MGYFSEQRLGDHHTRYHDCNSKVHDHLSHGTLGRSHGGDHGLFFCFSATGCLSYAVGIAVRYHVLDW